MASAIQREGRGLPLPEWRAVSELQMWNSEGEMSVCVCICLLSSAMAALSLETLGSKMQHYEIAVKALLPGPCDSSLFFVHRTALESLNFFNFEINCLIL